MTTRICKPRTLLPSGENIPQADCQESLDQYGQSYLRYHPATSPRELANIVKDMETRIGRKLKMFPADHRQIVSARVLIVGNVFRIEVASATLH